MVAGRGSEANISLFYLAYARFRCADDLAAFIEAVKAFYAGVPYHWEQDDRNEHYYQALLYTLLTAFGASGNHRDRFVPMILQLDISRGLACQGFAFLSDGNQFTSYLPDGFENHFHSFLTCMFFPTDVLRHQAL